MVLRGKFIADDEIFQINNLIIQRKYNMKNKVKQKLAEEKNKKYRGQIILKSKRESMDPKASSQKKKSLKVINLKLFCQSDKERIYK